MGMLTSGEINAVTATRDALPAKRQGLQAVLERLEGLPSPISHPLLRRANTLLLDLYRTLDETIRVNDDPVFPTSR